MEMLEVESYLDSFKGSIFKRLEHCEEKFHGIEVTQNECKRRLRRLELDRSRLDDNEEIEIQQVTINLKDIEI